jgi:hypothetical protein
MRRTIYANGNSLSWTNSIATNIPGRFFRVSVNAPNNGGVHELSLMDQLCDCQQRVGGGRHRPHGLAGCSSFVSWATPTARCGKTLRSGQAKILPPPPTRTSVETKPGRRLNTAGEGTGGRHPPVSMGPPRRGLFTNGIVTLVSQTDTRYGLHVTRTIELLFNEPVMRIYNDLFTDGPPRQRPWSTAILACGLIARPCRGTNTSRCYVPVPSPSIFCQRLYHHGRVPISPSLPVNFSNVNGLDLFRHARRGRQSQGWI